MIFQRKNISVFLFFVIFVQLGEGKSLQAINRTLFLFNHPNFCKNNEFYNLDYFKCVPCDSREYLKPSVDKLTCECERNATIVALYDSLKNQPICSNLCKKNLMCSNSVSTNSENTCHLKFINYTSESQNGQTKNIRIYLKSDDCRCDLKYNYIYEDYCIWKPLLKNFLIYNTFWKRGKFYVNLKFVAFFCISLQNMTACNNLANLCIQSFYDTGKNSPCSLFLLAQASDASLYSSIGENLDGLRPFLFYKRDKDTLMDMMDQIRISEGTLKLFSTVYSVEGHLIRWENLKPDTINLCGHVLKENQREFQIFKNIQVACELKLDSIIDIACAYANKYFVSVFLNHTREDDNIYLQTIPVLIENAFKGNTELNSAEWQLVKRFQIIAADTTFNSPNQPIGIFEDSYKLRFFKSIRILKKFELRCKITENNKLNVPFIVLEYHQIDLSSNASLNETYKFEFIVKFDKNPSSSLKFYGIVLSIFISISLIFAVFRAYIFKCRRNLEYFDIQVFFEAFLHLLSNIGNSFLAVVLLDLYYSVTSFLIGSDKLLTPVEKTHVNEFFIYSSLIFKSFYLFVKLWRISQVDLFFIDWERPKSSDTLLHLKNNLETSSQCSSIRTFADSNVSAWRIFFLANEWIDLSVKQLTSAFVQGFLSLTIFWVVTSFLPQFYSNSTLKIFVSITIYSCVYLTQTLFRHFLLNHLIGSPLNKFMYTCTLANVSIFTLMDCSFGFYIHGRSPHGFSDTDMSSMIFQLQRESQNMCGKRGLLNDSDFQTYIVFPPLKKHIEQLLPLKPRPEKLLQSQFQKDLNDVIRNTDGFHEKSTTYNRVNRFFCAFIDHAIKDMDYIIKEKTFVEDLLSCEFESFVGEQKGTFYIDDNLAFSSLFLYGNQKEIFLVELLVFSAINLLTNNFTISIAIVCISNKKMFRYWVKNNISTKTLIDKRFLM